ncbi:MAG: hypothetical protein L6Q84_09005 [Polyangiaceae bacterium]|nr:hypothetical protein [Polyangiaceae bacterium]
MGHRVLWVLVLSVLGCSSSTTNENGGGGGASSGGASTGGASGASSGGSGGGGTCSPASCWPAVDKSPACAGKWANCKAAGDCQAKAQNIVDQLCKGVVPADIPLIAAPVIECIASDKALSPLCYGVACKAKPGDKCSAVGLGEHCCAPLTCGADGNCK